MHNAVQRAAISFLFFLYLFFFLKKRKRKGKRKSRYFFALGLLGSARNDAGMQPTWQPLGKHVASLEDCGYFLRRDFIFIPKTICFYQFHP